MKKKTKIIIGAVAVLAAIGCNSNESSDTTNEVATVAEIPSTFDTEIETTVQEVLTIKIQSFFIIIIVRQMCTHNFVNIVYVHTI